MFAGYEPILVLLVIVAMLAAFISDRFRPELIALSAPVIFLVTGIVDVGEALQSFSQPAPFTVACMFVLSAALERTGVIDWVCAVQLSMMSSFGIPMLAAAASCPAVIWRRPSRRPSINC